MMSRTPVSSIPQSMTFPTHLNRYLEKKQMSSYNNSKSIFTENILSCPDELDYDFLKCVLLQ